MVSRPTARTRAPLAANRSGMAMQLALVWFVLFGISTSSALAQSAAAPAVAIGDITFSGSLRARSYSWDWFGGSQNGDYTYPGSLVRLGLSESKTAFDWQVEFALPVLLNLPTTAVTPA